MHIYWISVVAFVAILRCTATDPMIYGTADLEHDWAEAFKLIITVKMQYPVSDGWRMALIFSQPIRKIDVWRAEWMDTEVSEDETIHALKHLYFTKKLANGTILTFAVVAYKRDKNRSPGNVTVLFKGGNVIPRLPTEPPVSKMVLWLGCFLLITCLSCFVLSVRKEVQSHYDGMEAPTMYMVTGQQMDYLTKCWRRPGTDLHPTRGGGGGMG